LVIREIDSAGHRQGRKSAREDHSCETGRGKRTTLEIPNCSKVSGGEGLRVDRKTKIDLEEKVRKKSKRQAKTQPAISKKSTTESRRGG